MTACSALRASVLVSAALWSIQPQPDLAAAFQTGGTEREFREAERQIEEVERRREEALVRRDMKALDQIYDDDYTLITTSGEVQSKAQLLQRLESAELVVKSMQRSQVKLRVYGDVAVQTSLDSFRMQDPDMPPSGQKWVTRVYVRRSSGWRLAHVHDTLAAK